VEVVPCVRLIDYDRKQFPVDKTELDRVSGQRLGILPQQFVLHCQAPQRGYNTKVGEFNPIIQLGEYHEHHIAVHKLI
jgi:hypothetical protein